MFRRIATTTYSLFFVFSSVTMSSGCGTESPAPAPQRVVADQGPFAPSGAAPAIQLDILKGSYELPMTNLPASLDLEEGVGEFVLTKIREYKRPGDNQSKRRNPLWLARLPFHVPETSKRFKPIGMRVTINGEDVPFNTSSSVTAGGASWRIANQDLVLASRTEPKAGTVKITYPTMRQKIDKMAIGTADMEAYDFVQREYQVKDRTRRGIMIPAPGSAEWTVTLPPGASFTSHVTMMDPPLRRGRSDGAKIALVVVEGEEETIVGRKSLQPNTERFEKWTADLSKWAGKEVLLRINSNPGTAKNSDYDYLFFGSPVVTGTPADPEAVRRILVLGLDTTRPDRLGTYGYDRPTSPEIDSFASEAYVFERAYTPAPRTRPSFRTATTGRWPLDAVGASNLGAVFRENGWATSGCVANIHLNPRFDFDDGFDDWRLDVQANAEEQADRAIKYFTDNQDRDAYLFLHIMDPHLFYKAPKEYNDQFVTDPDPDLPPLFNRWEVVGWQRKGGLSEKRKKHISDLYDAEIAFTDAHVGRMLKAIKELPGQTLVIIHSDHGEELWEHDGFEHNHTLYNELVQAVLIVQPPGGVDGGSRISKPVSIVDIGATVFDFAGLENTPEQDGLSLRPLMQGKAGPEYDRSLPVAFLRYDRERWAVVHEGYKYILHTGSGQEELYNLTEDFGETENLAQQLDTAPYVKALGEAFGITAGPGWRMKVDLRGSDPIHVKLPKPALGANVIDPEAMSPHRANQSWGEPPKRVPAQVGTVVLDEDRMGFQFTPGKDGTGTLWIHFDEPVDAAPTIERGGEVIGPACAKTGDDGRCANAADYKWAAAPHSIVINPGNIVVPPVGEAARIKALQGDTDNIASEDLALLTALGYVGEEGADGEKEDEKKGEDHEHH
jgi:arylsulfatase A-like enzyme